jgi:hypothetical protein
MSSAMTEPAIPFSQDTVFAGEAYYRAAELAQQIAAQIEAEKARPGPSRRLVLLKRARWHADGLAQSLRPFAGLA